MCHFSKESAPACYKKGKEWGGGVGGLGEEGRRRWESKFFSEQLHLHFMLLLWNIL